MPNKEMWQEIQKEHEQDVFQELDEMDDVRREIYLRLLKPEIVEKYKVRSKK